MIINPIHTRVFIEGESLFSFIVSYLPKLKERTILVVTSKIVALSENRTLIIKNKQTKSEAIKKESQRAIKTKYAWLTIKDGMFMASAGIDESNANGKLILLPKDSFYTARSLRRALIKKYRIKRLGVIITDSRTTPLRSGVVGATLGYAGFKGLKDYRGKPDIFGRPFHFSQVNMADSLAAAAVFVMGEGKEQRPLALISEAEVEFASRTKKRELLIDPSDDMYKPLFKRI